jgi:hypothetical protein
MKTRTQRVRGSVAIEYLMLAVVVVAGLAFFDLDAYWTAITSAAEALMSPFPPP